MAESPRWRFFLIDVDGTLLTSRGEITPRSRAALARMAAQGATLVLASGRTYPSLQRAAGPLALPYYLISNGGAVGLTPGVASVCHTNFLDGALWPQVVRALQAEGLSTVVFSHRHPEPPLFYVAALAGHPHFEAYLGRHQAACRVAPDLAEAEIPQVVEVAALGSGPAFESASARAMAGLNGRTRSHAMVLYLSARYGRITEFFQADTSKWNAFEAMFPDARAHPEQVVAIGDEANDVEMIARAGLGIAMGNATDQLKQAADRVTADNDHEGLALALEALLPATP